MKKELIKEVDFSKDIYVILELIQKKKKTLY